MKEGPIRRLRPYLDASAWLLVLALGACGGDDASPSGADADGGGTAGATSDEGRSGPGAEATALCIDACDHQIEAGCSGTTARYLPFCVNICERTTEQTLDDCLDELLVLEQCRASLAWECDGFGGSQPTSTCAAESGACLQCMGGTLCAAPGLGP